VINVTTDIARKAVLGWLSVANAAALSAFVVTLPGIIVSRAAVELSGDSSIGGVAGRTGPGALLILAIDLSLGLLVAVAGVIRKERPIWVHGLGVSLNLGAPAIGLVILYALYH